MTAELMTITYADLPVHKIRESLTWARLRLREDLDAEEREFCEGIERDCLAELERREVRWLTPDEAAAERHGPGKMVDPGAAE